MRASSRPQGRCEVRGVRCGGNRNSCSRTSHLSPVTLSGHLLRGGLTFIEMLVALALLTLVAGAIAATLSGGLSVWQRAQTVGTRDQELQVAFLQLQHDLHGARRFAPIPFEGAYDAVSFPALVTTERPLPRAQAKDPRQAEEEDMVLGRLGYFFDSGHRCVCRSSFEYRDVRLKRVKDACRPLLTDVERARFAYYGWDDASAGYGWVSNWCSPAPPLAVKIEVGWRRVATQPLASDTLLVRLPIAFSEEKTRE